ncbi:hypothetical protein L2E82_11762 [Cichorium intybus]|uniref:Uncharacterized protein n=1 Tax=Cichorium intybus TaxID=13427 RepID=A0ACB9GEX6_CICIN|nr:hypothetical protein L2E82_11762 [Cichorium intybus]
MAVGKENIEMVEITKPQTGINSLQVLLISDPDTDKGSDGTELRCPIVVTGFGRTSPLAFLIASIDHSSYPIKTCLKDHGFNRDH